MDNGKIKTLYQVKKHTSQIILSPIFNITAESMFFSKTLKIFKELKSFRVMTQIDKHTLWKIYKQFRSKKRFSLFYQKWEIAINLIVLSKYIKGQPKIKAKANDLVQKILFFISFSLLLARKFNPFFMNLLLSMLIWIKQEKDNKRDTLPVKNYQSKGKIRVWSNYGPTICFVLHFVVCHLHDAFPANQKAKRDSE